MKTIPFVLLIIALIVGCGKQSGQEYEKVILEFRFVETDSTYGLQKFLIRKGDQIFFVHKEVLADNSDIADASVQKVNDDYGIFVEFTEKGKYKWAQITQNNIGKRIGILLNNELITAPIIRAKIEQGLAIITGGFNEEGAVKIAEGIKIK